MEKCTLASIGFQEDDMLGFQNHLAENHVPHLVNL